MRDRNGTPIHDHDAVLFQHGPEGRAHAAQVIDSNSHRAHQLKAILLRFTNGSSQFVPPDSVEVQEL